MRILTVIIMIAILALTGCTNMQRLAYSYSKEALSPSVYQYQDGGTSLYYSFVMKDGADPDAFVFFYGGSGCPSWKYVMPEYINGLTVSARVFALNKRFVTDRSTGMFGCGNDFYLANNPDQWVADYAEFIAAQLKAASPKPKKIVLVGVSEGALTAALVAGMMPEVTNVATIGNGGYPMRRSLSILKQKGVISFDVETGWKEIATDPRSVEKKWYGNTYRWWSEILDIDPTPHFLKLDIPILVGIGEKDESIPVESARYLESRFKEVGKSNLILKIYPGADHRLNVDGVSHRSEFFLELSHMLRPAESAASKRDK